MKAKSSKIIMSVCVAVLLLLLLFAISFTFAAVIVGGFLTASNMFYPSFTVRVDMVIGSILIVSAMIWSFFVVKAFFDNIFQSKKLVKIQTALEEMTSRPASGNPPESK
jgi:hypothetical protein